MTSKDLKELKALIKLCKTNKITYFKHKDFELSFDYSKETEKDPNAVYSYEEYEQKYLNKKPKQIPEHTPIKEDIIPEEDMLLWSTPHYQEEKPQVNGELEQ